MQGLLVAPTRSLTGDHQHRVLHSRAGIPAKLGRGSAVERHLSSCRQLKHIRHLAAGCLISPGISAFPDYGCRVVKSGWVGTLPVGSL